MHPEVLCQVRAINRAMRPLCRNRPGRWLGLGESLVRKAWDTTRRASKEDDQEVQSVASDVRIRVKLERFSRTAMHPLSVLTEMLVKSVPVLLDVQRGFGEIPMIQTKRYPSLPTTDRVEKTHPAHDQSRRMHGQHRTPDPGVVRGNLSIHQPVSEGSTMSPPRFPVARELCLGETMRILINP